MIEKLTDKLLAVIKLNTDAIDNNEKEDVIRYGLDILIYNTLLLLLFIGLALVWGSIKEFLISLAVYGSLRITAGGAHAKTRFTCSLLSALIFFGSVFAANYIKLNSIFPSILLFLVNTTVIMIFAPGDTIEKPILNNKIRILQKISSQSVTIVIFIISIKLYKYDMVSYGIILFSDIPFLLLLTPLGYKLLGCTYGSNCLEGR